MNEQQLCNTVTAEQGEAGPQAPTPPAAWLPILLVCLGGVSGCWVLASRSWFSTWHGFPNTASTTLLFLAAAAATTGAVPRRYRRSMVAGLGFSALGDAFLMLPSDRFVAGLCSFLVAHICYLWGLTSDSLLARHKAPFVACGIFAVVLMAWLWPGVPGPLRLPVVLYAAALLGMAAQATSRTLARSGAGKNAGAPGGRDAGRDAGAPGTLDTGALLAAIGAALFVISDAVLAFQRFRHPLEWGRLIVLGTYFAAQGGIALSVVMYRPGRRS